MTNEMSDQSNDGTGRRTCGHCGKVLHDGQYAFDHLVQSHDIAEHEAKHAVEAIGWSVDADTKQSDEEGLSD